MKRLLTLLCALLCASCQSNDLLSGKNDPSAESWELAFTEPYCMKVWVEDSAVEDINGKLFKRTGGGTAAGGEPENGKESARGWHAVGAASKAVIGADLPKRIYVR